MTLHHPRLSFRVSSLVVLFLATTLAYAAPVDPATAKRAAMAHHELMMKGSSSIMGSRGPAELTLAAQGVATIASGESRTIYYVFNVDDDGFVVVAGDDLVRPILGFSDESSYSAGKPSPEFAWWMTQYQSQIIGIIDADNGESVAARREWSRLLEGKGSSGMLSSASVGPLVQTRWDQGDYYNTLCPYDNAAREQTVTGCVATSFAQIVKYHGFPAKGMGDHGYTHPKYGYLYANFANAIYDWSAMPNRVSSPNNAVATLMYHLGVAFDMEYGPGSTGGSGAYPSNAAAALKRYFGYKSSVRDVERRGYGTQAWEALIRSELDARRPVEYHGQSGEGGHSFVCDGYRDEYFHMNWGWDGDFNGYFLLSNLSPDGVGTGGGAGAYNQEQGAVIGIEPGSGSGPQPDAAIDIRMNSWITAYPNPVTANGIIAVNFDLVNAAPTTFRGDYCAALFDAEGEFVTYLGGIIPNAELPTTYHYTNGITVRDTLFGLRPGTYMVGIYARPTGGEWSVVGNQLYASTMLLMVTKAAYGNALELFSDITVAPDPIHSGQPFELTVDCANRGYAAFNGEIGAFAYTLDGRGVGEVAIRQNLQLGAERHWTNGVTLTSPGLAVEPGRYLIMFFSRATGGEWMPINPDEYTNPVIVEILPQALLADRYEDNNTAANAYRLPLVFTSSTATIGTPGSNHHVSGDDDYYRIDLPAGYEYDIVASVRDHGNSGAADYTDDAAVLWNAGTGWSDVTDDSTEVIHVTGGRTIQFKVQSLFRGTMGTYRLDLRVTRRGAASVEERAEGVSTSLRAYPSPAVDHLYIDPVAPVGSLVDISLVDAMGRTVLSSNGVTQGPGPIMLELAGQPSGSYLLVMTGAGRTWTKMVRVQR